MPINLKGTMYAQLTKERVLRPKYITLIGVYLTLLYAIGAPAWDLRYKTVRTIGGFFLDARHNTTTFDNYLYFIMYVPLILFASIWAYGAYRLIQRHKSKYANSNAIITVAVIFIVSLALYFLMDAAFGFYYHFVF